MGGASASTTVEKAAKASKPAAAPVGGVQRGRDNEGFRHPPAPSAAATAARTAKGTGRRPKTRGQKPNETIRRRDSRSTTDGELRTYRKKPQSRAAVSAKKTARAV